MHTLEHPPRSAPRPVPRGRSRTIGVLSLDPTPYGKTSALLGIHRATRDSGHFVSIVSVPAPDRPIAAAWPSLGCGAWLSTGSSSSLRSAPRSTCSPSCRPTSPSWWSPRGRRSSSPAVAIDHYSGAAAATRHLLELGHRTVFHIAGPADRQDPGPRLAGWRDTLVAAGADIPLPMVGDWSADGGYELGWRLAARNDVTAIFAANDQMALGVLRALHEAGRRVPRDVSVVGFDGIPQGEFFNPPLTTVRQNFAEMGRRSLELLLSEIEVGRHANPRDDPGRADRPRQHRDRVEREAARGPLRTRPVSSRARSAGRLRPGRGQR